MSESEVEKVEMSSSGKVEMPSSGDSDTDEWLKMEARFRDEGQAYGLKGLDLLKYVQDLLAQPKRGDRGLKNAKSVSGSKKPKRLGCEGSTS